LVFFLALRLGFSVREAASIGIIGGAAGLSAFPMAARVVQKEGQKANLRSFLLWHAVGANTGGQIGLVMAAAVMLAIMSGMGIGPALQ